MYNLEQAITEWRRKMLAAGIETPAPLEELELHLREEINAEVSAGTPEADAFQIAISRLGSPATTRREFDKIKNGSCWTVKIGSAIWIGAAVMLAAFWGRNLMDGKISLLLFTHVFTVTIGYGAAFLLGGFGLLYTGWRRFGRLSAGRKQALGRAVQLFSILSAGFVAAGFLLGIIWSRQNLGRYWGSDPREIGAVCAIVWATLIGLSKRFSWLGERAIILMCIFGNIVVSVAWFGAGILNSFAESHHLQTEAFWSLTAFLGINALFLLIGMVPDNNRGIHDEEISHV